MQVIEPSRTGRIPGNHESRRQTYQPGTGSVPADKQCENQQTPENVQPQAVLLESRDVLGDRVCEKNRQPNCTVVGVPGRIVKRDNIKVPRSDMDQVHLPDPVMEDITLLQRENSALCNRIIEMEQEIRQLRIDVKKPE